MKTSYITLPNSLLDMKLTANELAVLFYISSIYSGKKQVRVRQAVIARRCGIKTTQTVSRITASLAMKGLLEQRRCIYSANDSGIMFYTVCLPSADNGYFKVSRHILDEGLTPQQMRLYLFICRSVSSKLGYCWNSYNDLAKLIGMKRSDVITLMTQLHRKNVIRKQLVKSRGNRRVYVDNHYFTVEYVKHSPIRKRGNINKKELLRDLSSSKTNVLLNITCKTIPNALSMIAPIFQFVKWHLCMSRGSPLNHSSVILPKDSFLQK